MAANTPATARRRGQAGGVSGFSNISVATDGLVEACRGPGRSSRSSLTGASRVPAICSSNSTRASDRRRSRRSVRKSIAPIPAAAASDSAVTAIKIVSMAKLPALRILVVSRPLPHLRAARYGGQARIDRAAHSQRWSLPQFEGDRDFNHDIDGNAVPSRRREAPLLHCVNGVPVQPAAEPLKDFHVADAAIGAHDDLENHIS